MLQAVLAVENGATVAEELHVSIRTLRRYTAGTLRMNWVTHTRLMGLVETLEAKRNAEQRDAEQRDAAEWDRASANRKRHASGSYARVASPVVA